MDADLTLAEAAELLQPQLNEKQLILIVAALNLPHSGVRHTGTGGRPRRTYPAAQIMQLHAALLPWLGVSVK